MAEKPVKVKETEKNKNAVVEKAKSTKPVAEKAKAAPVKAADKGKDKTQPKKPNRIQVWWRETVGELRKVSWPTIPEARRMTGIVLIVMAVTASVLGFLNFVFAQLIGWLARL